MPHDIANTERFSAVIKLCDQIDEFFMYEVDTEDAASEQLADAIGVVVGTVLHSIWDRKHHAVVIDARLGVEGYDDTPIETKVPTPSRPIQLELGSDLQPTSDHPVWKCLDQVHTFVIDLYEASDDPDARRMLDALLLTIGGIDVAIREDKVTNTLICTDAQSGTVNLTAMPMRME